MNRKYAPEIPDAKWHRGGDTGYLRELLSAAKLSQRGAAPILGVDERTMRYKASGERELTYAEQYMLEVLADKAQTGDLMNTVHETAATYEPKIKAATVWHQASERSLRKNDAGKIIIGYDRYRVPIVGKLIADGFGLVVQDIDGLDVHRTPVDRVSLYTLLDPPSD